MFHFRWGVSDRCVMCLFWKCRITITDCHENTLSPEVSRKCRNFEKSFIVSDYYSPPSVTRARYAIFSEFLQKIKKVTELSIIAPALYTGEDGRFVKNCERTKLAVASSN